jgi:hypothetical protein
MVVRVAGPMDAHDNQTIAYAGVVILVHLYLLEQCLDPMFRSSIKTLNFVTF